MTKKERAAINARLRILGGQVESLSRAVEVGKPCAYILEQLSSMRAATTGLGIELLLTGARTAQTLEEGRARETVLEMVRALVRPL